LGFVDSREHFRGFFKFPGVQFIEPLEKKLAILNTELGEFIQNFDHAHGEKLPYESKRGKLSLLVCDAQFPYLCRSRGVHHVERSKQGRGANIFTFWKRSEKIRICFGQTRKQTG